jgi:hypothetical protein
MEQFLARMERLLVGFEQLFEVLKALMQQGSEEKSPYQYGHMTAFWIKKVDDGNSCLQELIDSVRWHEEDRAKRGYPIDKSYHGPLAEAIGVLQARQPVTVEQLLKRIEAGNLEREDIILGVQIREEAKGIGWKNAQKPVEAEEAELANYASVLAMLTQPQL